MSYVQQENKRKIETLEKQKAEMNVELFVRENPCLTDKQLREFYQQSKDAKAIFFRAESFLWWARHLPEKK